MLPLTYKKPEDVLKAITKQGIFFVDLKFCDPFSQWQHITLPAHEFPLEIFRTGMPFDGSSIRGWKAINESDMLLIPDAASAFIDTFGSEPMMSLVCDVIDPITKKPYSRDSRYIAKKSVEALIKSGIGDTAAMGPEAEFFIFDDMRFSNGPNHSFYEVDSVEGWWNTGEEEVPNLGGKIPYKRGYFPVAPLDKTANLRAHMMRALEEAGIVVERGHHEVATAGQGEINFRFSDLLRCADNLMIFRYILKNVAARYGKVLTFLPKPLAGDNGSGMHTHFSLWKKKKNLFAGTGPAGLSDMGLFAIGGIISHAHALAAFTNPTMNSYHRLVPGFEAPVRLAYSARNRSAAIRIPVGSSSPQARRIEVRFPDGSANPYLAFAALLMAALDGIKRKLHPGKPLDKDIYALSPEELARVPQMPGSLEQSLHALEKDHAFLIQDNVFDKDFIAIWTEAKQEEINAIRLVPHPKEFELYYDV